MPNRKCDILEFRKGLEKSITDYETNESRIKHCSRPGRLWSLLANWLGAREFSCETIVV
jgi:hypothetical protein